MMSRTEAEVLIEKYNRGQASSEEKAKLERWYHIEISRRELREEDGDFLLLKDVLWGGVLERADLSVAENTVDLRPTKRFPFRIARIAAVAAIVLLFGTATWLYWSGQNADRLDTPVTAMDAVVSPGGNRAKLTLTDGREIELSELQNGILVGESGIRYPDGSGVLEDDETAGAKYATLSTPRGGTYQITLPDGTRVWLNAASTLIYPVQFSPGQNRVVELEGEAYFEVAKKKTNNKDELFIVRSKSQILEVLGTHFNISAYPDETAVKTTLVEGKVSVSHSDQSSTEILSPGQQSVLHDADIQVREVNTEVMTAWRSGTFIFDDTPLHEVLRQVARWYDIEVDLAPIPARQITGIVSRDEKLSALLDALTISSGLNFTLEERRLVLKKH